MSGTVQKDETPVLLTTSSADQVRSSQGVKSPSGKNHRRRPPKRPFTSGHKVIHPSESKQQLRDSARLTSPLLDFHPLFISMRGLVSLCIIMHENLRIRDRHLYNVSAADMLYTSLIYAILKILRCDAARGFVDPDLSLLEFTMEGVMFPAVITDYLDSIGSVTLSNGINVMPSLTSWIEWDGPNLSDRMRTYVRRHFMHPGLCIPENGLPLWYQCATSDIDIPTVEPGQITVARWCLMPTVIERYRRLVPRMTKSVDVRAPTPSCEGQLNMIACRRTLQCDTVCGMAPQIMSDESAQIGAVFGWNYFEERSGWPGDHEILIPLTAGVTFSLSNVLARLAQTKMKLFLTC